MRLTLITPTPPDISAFGVRALSAFLKSKGYEVRSIFLPGGIERLQHGRVVRYIYPELVLNQISDLCQDADFIGISFMSQYRDRAIQITKYLKRRLQTPVVWGGIHPEVIPEEAMGYADAVCVTEGETVLLETLQRMEMGKSLNDIPGLWISNNDELIKTPVPSLIQDLDALPFPDFSLENHYYLDPIEEKIKPLTDSAWEHITPLMPAPVRGAFKVYRTMTSRGCPHRCTYCANQIKADLHPGEKYLRFRSPSHVIDELKMIIERFPFIQGIHFFDDVFTAMPAERLNTLCSRFKKEIGLPFYAQASPAILTKAQLEMFLDAGLVFIEMGIQTGSTRIQNMYRRAENNTQTRDAANLIYEYREKLITPHYHVILDNPWESQQEVIDTLIFLTQIPGKFKLCLASLTLYPGTELNRRALVENLIRDPETEIYQKPFYIPKGRYLNYLIYLTDIAWIPRCCLRFLSKFPFIILDRPSFGPVFDVLRRVTDKFRLIGKGLQAMTRGDIKRIRNYFQRTQ